jgi:hypothetical protein
MTNELYQLVSTRQEDGSITHDERGENSMLEHGKTNLWGFRDDVLAAARVYHESMLKDGRITGITTTFEVRK